MARSGVTATVERLSRFWRSPGAAVSLQGLAALLVAAILVSREGLSLLNVLLLTATGWMFTEGHRQRAKTRRDRAWRAAAWGALTSDADWTVEPGWASDETPGRDAQEESGGRRYDEAQELGSAETVEQ